ncbi:anaerobic ribonucleoside-triphosphate reductase activating protein [bacterium]|nr:anaerobic ribonucleoside-triphosphate reductase activating protein [bacterium]MBT6754240.1 anaerobic ribonucleoside-triphosphate reductase activating protein [bacterium]MBT7432068.1 anaerobic ribonucleoside-triphosphate reductase activating protein [bacterium]
MIWQRGIIEYYGKEMILGGLQKLTLIDYPGKVAATVFTVGCNFRCPFCHNPELVVSGTGFERGSLSEEEFFSFLEKRKGKLDGVCVTGGEPTIQKGIVEFLEKIKKMGFLVKLDSNGTRPDILKEVFAKKLVDFVAMDIKNSLESYRKTCGADVDLERIKLSVDLIRNSSVAYEFRTTVVSGIHTMEDFILMGKWLDGINNFALQLYRDEGKILNEELRKKASGQKMDLEKIKKQLEKHFKKITIR